MRYLRILKETILGFFKDQAFLHASSLTFYTLLSVVPILAVAFGLAKGFGFEKTFEDELTAKFSEHQVVFDYVIRFAHQMLEQVEGGFIAGIGAILLFIFVLSLFWTIENSMNVIWKVKRTRPAMRMLTDYLAMMIICPFLFVMIGSMTLQITTQVTQVVQEHEILQPVTPLLSFAYKTFTCVLVWILFSCIYIIMPNTRVKPRYGIIAGILSGTLYYFMQMAVLQFQIGVSQYNAVYGSFAALPLFLLWLQISWTLVLLGAELAYHSEELAPVMNASKNRESISRSELAILIAHQIVHQFSEGKDAIDVERLSCNFGVPKSQIQSLFDDLHSAGIVAEVKTEKNIKAYQAGKRPGEITVKSVLDAIDPNIQKHLEINITTETNQVKNAFQAYREDNRNPTLLAIP